VTLWGKAASMWRYDASPKYFYHAKPQSRKDTKKEIIPFPYLCAFA
jgi:hypothetical protein